MSLYATHNKLIVKISKINNLFEYITKRKILRTKNIGKFQRIIDSFKELEDEYMLEMAMVMVEQSTSDYDTYVSRTNIDTRLTQFVSSVKSLLEKNDKIISEKIMIRLNNKLSCCDKNVLDVKSPKIQYYICTECKVPKEVFPNLSEMRCSECAEIEKMEGTDFEEHSIQDPNKQKKGDYDPTRFVDIWIDRTLAVREVNFIDKKTGKQEALIAVVEEAKKSNIKSKYEITCEYIRQVWKLRGFTSYNDDAAYARYLLTGIRPYQPSFNNKRFIKTMVIRIMRIFNQIKDASRSNSLYYAYVIYKVIKQFYVGKPEITLLESIHIQKDETLAYNDLEYEKICKRHNIQYKTPKLIYEPTVSERTCN